ncbi:hypothetical protein NKR23_g2548 [Pleurostoma richardsiae]|uniref:Uncharacterized protein n=1 Tax=Pleurostoma richardsiae TaxID=41990 RepID=A0AA38VYH2_9PEZI|nr:hypothetical protein NKR23_g2548 [Pleurostoma richardsiae]
MGPPRAPPARIVVDEFGREYIEPPPPPPSVVRHSVAPSAQSAGETEVIYERTAAIPTVSKMPEADTFQQEGVVYRRVSPGPYSVPRRVMTQPEYVNPDYRAYRQREYSIRPMAPADGYIQVRGATESRPSDAPREYMTRAMSVRPAEPIRYEAPAEYGARVQSVRPEPILREYASSLRSDHRREIAQTPTPREYSMRTGEVPQVIRREYSVRPVEPPQYCERPVRGDEGMTYIERPRGAPQENIYDDGVQRPVYR